MRQVDFHTEVLPILRRRTAIKMLPSTPELVAEYEALDRELDRIREYAGIAARTDTTLRDIEAQRAELKAAITTFTTGVAAALADLRAAGLNLHLKPRRCLPVLGGST